MLKEFVITFALQMSVRRAVQSERKLDASAWWADLSEAIEEGISLHEVQTRRAASEAPLA